MNPVICNAIHSSIKIHICHYITVSHIRTSARKGKQNYQQECLCTCARVFQSVIGSFIVKVVNCNVVMYE